MYKCTVREMTEAQGVWRDAKVEDGNKTAKRTCPAAEGNTPKRRLRVGELLLQSERTSREPGGDDDRGNVQVAVA